MQNQRKQMFNLLVSFKIVIECNDPVTTPFYVHLKKGGGQDLMWSSMLLLLLSSLSLDAKRNNEVFITLFTKPLKIFLDRDNFFIGISSHAYDQNKSMRTGRCYSYTFCYFFFYLIICLVCVKTTWCINNQDFFSQNENGFLKNI